MGDREFPEPLTGVVPDEDDLPALEPMTGIEPDAETAEVRADTWGPKKEDRPAGGDASAGA